MQLVRQNVWVIAPALGEELRLMAEWLNLGSITAPKAWQKRLAV